MQKQNQSPTLWSFTEGRNDFILMFGPLKYVMTLRTQLDAFGNPPAVVLFKHLNNFVRATVFFLFSLLFTPKISICSPALLPCLKNYKLNIGMQLTVSLIVAFLCLNIFSRRENSSFYLHTSDRKQVAIRNKNKVPLRLESNNMTFKGQGLIYAVPFSSIINNDALSLDIRVTPYGCVRPELWKIECDMPADPRHVNSSFFPASAFITNPFSH